MMDVISLHMASTKADKQEPIFERRSTTVKNRVQCKQDHVVSWLQEFYTQEGTLEKLIPIVNGTSSISLRLVDYFVTNYAKKMNTSFMANGKHFLIYFHYKRELNAYSKRLFDPFCRRERIMFQARGVEPFVTTVGQLNFFRWFIEKEILEYVVAHRDTIETDMNKTLKEHYSRSTTSSAAETTDAANTVSTPSTGSPSAGSSLGSESLVDTGATSRRKKRCELTSSAMKKVNVHECDITVSFG
jgi:hypothetical protein